MYKSLTSLLRQLLVETNSINRYTKKILVTRRSYKKMAFEYPNVRRDETLIDNYHGVAVPDPYRWLEDLDSEETKNFVEAQNALTEPYIANCPVKDRIRERLSLIWDYEKYSCPQKYGNKYFTFINSGLQNQSVLYIQDSLEEERRVFYDPNTLSEDGTISLADSIFSEDGSVFAYNLSVSGSDVGTIYFKDTTTGRDFEERLQKVKFSQISWTHDNLGIFYSCYPDMSVNDDGSEKIATQKNLNQKLFYHRLNTAQESDILVAEFPEDPALRIQAHVSDCGKWLILTPLKGCKHNLLYFCNLEATGEIRGLLELQSVVTEMNADYEYITTNGKTHLFKTNRNASTYRVIGIDVDKLNERDWKTIIPAHEKNVIYWAAPAGRELLVVCYTHDAKNALHLYKLNGERIYDFPMGPGTISSYFGRKCVNEIFFRFTSLLVPGINYRCDVTSPSFDLSVFRKTEIPGFDSSQYTINQIFYNSKDGTKIPMFIVKHKDTPLDGSHPCVLYGYGGFNLSVLPAFRISATFFVKHFNGCFAIANIRGGGEYGEEWHNAGRYDKKQNVFDDFLAAAEYLINQKYTSRDRLIIQGGSNGGLLVGACINQRPELFGAAIAHVGVMDMLRFHKFTIGHAWVTDYGSSDDPNQFKYLYKYSPLHNTFIPSPDDKGQYPGTLLLTADHDDRVVPSHSYKFIAQLQYCAKQSNNFQKNPLMIHIDSKAGHGGGKPTGKVIEETVNIFCFLNRALGLRFYE